MEELISRNQNAFIGGRCIQDNFALVQRAVKTLHRKKVPLLFLKLDVAKAFESGGLALPSSSPCEERIWRQMVKVDCLHAFLGFYTSTHQRQPHKQDLAC